MTKSIYFHVLGVLVIVLFCPLKVQWRTTVQNCLDLKHIL